LLGMVHVQLRIIRDGVLDAIAGYAQVTK